MLLSVSGASAFGTQDGDGVLKMEYLSGLLAAQNRPWLDAALALAEVSHLAGNVTAAEAETQRAIEHYEGKGAAAYVAYARRLAATWGTSRTVRT